MIINTRSCIWNAACLSSSKKALKKQRCKTAMIKFIHLHRISKYKFSSYHHQKGNEWYKHKASCSAKVDICTHSSSGHWCNHPSVLQRQILGHPLGKTFHYIAGTMSFHFCLFPIASLIPVCPRNVGFSEILIWTNQRKSLLLEWKTQPASYRMGLQCVLGCDTTPCRYLGLQQNHRLRL